MLSFITNIKLRKTIEDSMEYMNIIFNESQKGAKSDIYKEETYRVIILYIVAIIEAILLYVFKERKDKITTLDYKCPTELPKKYKHSDYPNGNLVTAVQIEKTKDEKEIGMKDLVDFMKKNNLMARETAENILEINDIRNTFHLTKTRESICIELKKVEAAFALLLKIIKGSPEAIKYKK